MISTFPVVLNLRRCLCALVFCLPLCLRATPTINQQPPNIVATVGDGAHFSVGANGTPLFYQWTSNGVAIPGANASEYIINPVADGDAAAYAVIVTNSTGSITSHVGLLTVVEPDIVATLPLGVPVNTCTNITLSVVTAGTDPNLSYQWYFGDDMTPVSSATSSNLVISGVEIANAGLYTVEVIDGGSSDFASGTLSVTDPPPVVMTQNITVDLDANGNASITAAQVDNGSYDNCSIANMSVSPSNFTCANVGDNRVTLSVTDNIGQTSQATAFVTVLDPVPPTAVFTTIPVQLDNTGSYTLSSSDMAAIGASSSDACGITNYSVTPSSFGFCNVGPNPVTLTVIDSHGNQSSVNGNLTVQAPVGPPAIVVVDTNYVGSCAAVTFPFANGTGTYYIGYNAFSSIQGGLNAAASSGTVTVAPGTYIESPQLSKSVTLRSSGGRDVTTIALHSADPLAFPYSAIVIAASSVSVEGFSVVGHDSSPSSLASDNFLLNPGVTNVDIANNLIEVGSYGSNSDGSDGFGILTTYGTSPPFADNLQVNDNIFQPVDAIPASDSVGAAFYVNPGLANLIVSNNSIMNLGASGVQATNALIINNTVSGTGPNGNSGGFFTWGYPDPTVWGHATFQGNTITNTGPAIALYDSEDVVIENNLLDGNGYGVFDTDTGSVPGYNQDATILIVDNSLASNSIAGIDNETETGTPNAVSNWWGDISGPSNPTLNPYGIGSSVSHNITFIPWLNNGSNSATYGFIPAIPDVAYPPAQLAFTVDPSGANLGSPLTAQPVVQVEDTYGNLTPWANPFVTNTLVNDPDPNATVAGTNPEQAVGGIATFTDLFVEGSGGANLALVASAAYLLPATSSLFNVTNPAPTISGINPFFARAGGDGFTITVDGSGFVGDSTVYWNGNPLVTTYVSSTELTAIVPAGDIANTNTAEVTVESPGPGGGPTGELAFQVDVATPPLVYVDSRYTGLATNTLVDWPYDTNTGPHIVGYDAFAAIQDAVTKVASSGTVNVAAGTYSGEVTIDQPLSLLGPNATNNPNSSVRVAEAVIRPDTSDPEIYDNTAVVIVNIESSNVTIKGFTVDGFNPDLTNSSVYSAGFFGYTNSGSAFLGTYYTSGGDTFNAAIGIGDFNGDNSIRIENNIVKNDSYSGVDLESDANSEPTTDSFIDCNLLENMDYAAEGFGDAVILYNNYYAKIANNSFTNVAIGISPQNFWQANPGDVRGQTITNNQVSASVAGIWLNLIYDSASTFQIVDNTSTFAATNGSPLYSALINTSNEWTGIKITSIQSSVGVSVKGNVITGPATDVGYYTEGYNVWNTPTTGNITISGGSVSNVDFGVWVNNYDGFQSPGGSTKSIVTNLTISGASAAGVYVQDDPRASTNGVVVSAVITGNTIINNSLVGVLVQGTNASGSVINNTASITGNGIGISVDTGKALVQGNDLAGNTVAAISVTNGAVVDAGNCTSNNVTGLGISTGGNNLSNYGFDSLAPWAIINGNPGGSPVVLADHDDFGAVLGNNIPGAFSGAVEYSQSPAVIGAPTDVLVVCVADVTNELAPATNLASFVALGGYYSGNSGTVSYSDNPPYPYFPGSGIIQRTYTITDGCGLVSTAAVQTITVSDTMPPTIDSLANLTFNTDPGQCSKSGVTWAVMAHDNCGVSNVLSIPPSGSTFSKGVTIVTNIAMDTSGNTTMTTFTVTVSDREAPTITSCATNRTVSADATAHYQIPDLTGQVTAMDNCDPVTFSQIPAPGTELGLGSTTVTVWAADMSGNSNSCTFTIDVIDTTAPTITCPSDVTVTVLQSKDPYNTGTATATDAGSSQENQAVTIFYSDNAALTNCDSTGTILRTWYAVDSSNNTNSCTQTITVIDDIPPVFTFTPTDIATTNDPTLCSAVVNYLAAQAVDVGYFDGFEDTNWVSGAVNQDQSYSWNDYNAHVSRVASGVGGIPAYRGNAYGLIDSTVAAVTPGSSGAYSILGGGNTPFAGGYRVALKVYVNLNDPAVINATPTTGYAWDLDTGTQTFDGSNGGYGRDYIFHTAAYGPSGVVVAADNNSSNNSTQRRNDLLSLPNHAVLTNSGWYTFEWVFRDTNGVLAADLNVRDTNDTLLFSQTLSDPSDLTSNISGNPFYLWFNFLAVDTLPIDDTLYARYETVSSVPVSGSAFPVGTTTVTNTVADACGNSTNTTFTVTVADVEPPSAIRPADITVTNDPGQCGAMVSFAIPTNTDNCGVASVVATPASGSIFPVGTTPVTVVVTDIHGNTNSCTFNVTVNDTEPPSANVPAEIVQANDPGQCGAIVNFTLPTQTDNCGVAVSTATPPSGSFFPVGTTVVTVVVTDIHGNAATNTFNVVVNDTELPVVTCPANIVQGVDPGQTYATVSFIPTATDNCAIQSIVATPASGSHFPVGINPVSVVATDIHGNTQTCSFTVQVVGLPQIVQQPMSRTNNAGTTATFSVTATSPTPLSYLWKKNGVGLSDGGNISGSATSTLMIGSVSNADVASYSVCVSNLAGAVLSSNATLTVIDPPVIVSQPVSVTNNATTTATFAVTVDGTEPFGYQWYKNGTNQLVDGGNISGSLSNILTLTNVLAADRGQYSVVVTNPAGVVVSSNATLSVVDPWIVTQPANTTQPLGGTATFSVSALGTTPLTYLWQQNGVGIPGATNSSYTISVIRDSDAGPYNVIVSSAGRSVTSSNATLTVTHPPVFVTQPSSQTVIQGQTASFNVTMNGTTPFTFQWQFNSVNIPGATSHSLTLSGVTTANAGDYDVLVTNADGFAISTQAVLTVIVPPSFVTQPTSITNNAGTTATFSVTANGTALTYQWFKNGTNSLSDGANVSGSATATLTLSNVLGGDAGTYSVTIANLAGPLTSSNAALTVIDPVITNEPSNISVILGQPASFSVGAVGTSPVYQWRNGGIPIGNATNSSYSIASTADADAGSYDVIVTTIYGNVTSTPPAVLTVFDPAVVIHDPVSITRNAGTTASFTVVAGGTAPLTYQWLKNSSPLTDSGRIMGSLTSTLTISDVNDTDVSGYSVVVMNPYGTNTSASASLTVIDPPVITNEPVSVTNNAGTTAVFTVGVSGTQPLSYQWYKNGTNQLADGGNVLGATSNILTLSNVFGIDRGDYSVIVTNVAGTATSSNATLSVIDPVITVQPTNITAIDGSTVSFSVTTVGTLPLHYQWRQDDSDLADGFGISGSGTATLTITNVADSDEGNYSVVITNSEGVATSVEAVLTTVPPLIVFQPTNAYVLVGQPFSFSVSVNGVQPFSYQWVLNNTNINNATNRIYSVSAASFSDAGTYYVVVANTNGSETSANAVLQVYATAGSTVTFLGRTNGNANIELQGVPTFTYQLQASTDLSTTNWVPVATNTSPFIFIDTNHFPQRFYRGLYAP